jgi:tetratricopeptide (TPR) repeat protein
MPFLCRGADAAIQEYQRAIDLNPNFAAAHGYLGYALAMAERTDEGIAHLKQAIQMSPQDTQNAIFNMGLSVAHYLAGRYAGSRHFRPEGRTPARWDNGWPPHLSGEPRAGWPSGGGAHRVEHLKELQPDLSIAWCELYIPYTPAPMAKFLEGLRKRRRAINCLPVCRFNGLCPG